MPLGSGKYPDTITAEILAKHAHISSAEILRDILDTRREIAQLEKMEDAERTLAATHLDESERRMMAFKAEGRPSQRARRAEFVAYLAKILRARGQPWMSVEEWLAIPHRQLSAEEIAALPVGYQYAVRDGNGMLCLAEIVAPGQRVLISVREVVYDGRVE